MENITIAEVQRVPFQLRSLETNRIHPLRGYTSIGRSRKLLDPERDLIIDGTLSPDVGRVHGHIKACLLPDYATWLLRVYTSQREKVALQSVDGKYVVSQTDGRLIAYKHEICPMSVFDVERKDNEYSHVMLRAANGKYVVADVPGIGPGERAPLRATGVGQGTKFIMNVHQGGVVSMNMLGHKTTWFTADERGSIHIHNSTKGQQNRSRFLKVDVTGGLGIAEGKGHAGSGTSVDGDPVDKDIGAPVQPGSVIRFGKNELWVVECSALYSKSERAGAAQNRAVLLEEDDPALMRELHIPSIACHDALQSCKDWISIVRVVLEWLGEPDEPPCVDCIEVTDELRRTASIHQVSVFEEQQAFDVKKILCDVRLGTTLKMRLSSDPYLLAPVLSYMDDLNKWLTSQYASHMH